MKLTMIEKNKKKSTDIPLELLLNAVKVNLPSNILEKNNPWKK